LLLKRGADINVDRWESQTPLDMALESRLKQIASLLRKAGGKRRDET
jgi:hypothetical protein